MRRINNLTNWTIFTGDARQYARQKWGDATVYFAVSKDGEKMDGHAKIEYLPLPWNEYDFYSNLNWLDVASAKKDMSPKEFYYDVIELLGVESFYICDAGANYSWL